MVVGTIIGASIFMQPSEVAGRVPSLWAVLLVWLFSGMLTMIGALVCAELATRFTASGGVYVFLRESYGRPVAFLWGWAMLVSMHSGIIAVIAVVFARYTAYFVQLSDAGIKLVAIAAIATLSAVNYVGVRHGAGLQALFTAGKLLAIAVIIVMGFALGGGLPDHFVPAQELAREISVSDFLTAMVAGLFAFGGWHMVTYNAEETVEPARTIPRALIFGTVIVTLSYVGMNAVYMYVLPLDTVASSTRVAADGADVLIGFGGGAAMSAIVMFSTFGALAGIILAGPRVYLAMARDRMLFAWMGRVHGEYHTPHHAIVAQAIFASALVATGTFQALFTRVIYTEWIFFGLLAIGLLLLRRRESSPAVKRFAGPAIFPIVFVISSFAIVGNQVVTNMVESLTGLSLVAAGFPIYYLWIRRNRGKDAPA